VFATFDAYLKAQGYLAMSGQIVDATIVAAPRQRNTDEEKKAIKEGRIPEGWRDKPAKLAQKDRDARWTLKRAKARPAGEDGKAKVEIAIPVFGYKNHVSIDRAHGLIRRFAVTNAAAHDGARLPDVLDKTNTASPVWADTAYRSKANEAHMARNGFASKVHFRRAGGADLTPSQAKANAARCKARSAVETVFAAQKHRFGLFVRTIGVARAKAKIGLANIVYNFNRMIWLQRRTAPA
jgi:IS5 family transposase